MSSVCRRVGVGASVTMRTVDSKQQRMKITVAIVILGESPGENWCICRLTKSLQHYTSAGGRRGDPCLAPERGAWGTQTRSQNPHPVSPNIGETRMGHPRRLGGIIWRL